MSEYKVIRRTVILDCLTLRADSKAEARKMVLVDEDWDDKCTHSHDVTIENVLQKPDPKPEPTQEEMQARRKGQPPIKIPYIPRHKGI
jgi:hypothetical protein